MPFITSALAALGVAGGATSLGAPLTAAIGAAGVGAQLFGMNKQMQGENQSNNANQQIAALQQQQLALDAARQRREIARRGILARSQSLSNATSNGAGFGASSGLAGGQAQITNQMGAGLLDSSQNEGIGNSLFAANREAFAGNSLTMTGQGISSFGGMIAQNAGLLGRVGSYVTGNRGWGSASSYAN